MLSSRSHHLLLFLSLLQDILLAHTLSCEEEGNLILAPGRNLIKLLLVCHNGMWGNVCSSQFNHLVDGEVVLQQLQCNTGATVTRSVNARKSAYRLGNTPCIGVERRLKDCSRYQNIKNNQNCDNRVGVYCNNNVRQCLNGELKNNETDNILYICVSGVWRPICSIFWGQVQATVACRQLNPGKILFRATPTHVPSATQHIFNYYFNCTGQETNITNCSLSLISDVYYYCNSNNAAGVQCGIGSVSTPTELIITATNSFTVEANWTQPTSDSQHYTNLTISCTSTHGVYIATQYVNVSAAGNERMHMMISGLMPNTSYNCCVSVYTELGRSEHVCGSVTTVPSSSPLHVDGRSQSGTDLAIGWIVGIIIGAVLATVTLLIVWATVWMIRRRQTSQHKLREHDQRPINSEERNEDYNMYSYPSVESRHNIQIPQPYEIPQVREVNQSATLTLGNRLYEPASENALGRNTHITEPSVGAGNTSVT